MINEAQVQSEINPGEADPAVSGNGVASHEGEICPVRAAVALPNVYIAETTGEDSPRVYRLDANSNTGRFGRDEVGRSTDRRAALARRGAGTGNARTGAYARNAGTRAETGTSRTRTEAWAPRTGTEAGTPRTGTEARNTRTRAKAGAYAWNAQPRDHSPGIIAGSVARICSTICIRTKKIGNRVGIRHLSSSFLCF